MTKYKKASPSQQGAEAITLASRTTLTGEFLSHLHLQHQDFLDLTDGRTGRDAGPSGLQKAQVFFYSLLFPLSSCSSWVRS